MTDYVRNASLVSGTIPASRIPTINNIPGSLNIAAKSFGTIPAQRTTVGTTPLQNFPGTLSIISKTSGTLGPTRIATGTYTRLAMGTLQARTLGSAINLQGKTLGSVGNIIFKGNASGNIVWKGQPAGRPADTLFAIDQPGPSSTLSIETSNAGQTGPVERVRFGGNASQGGGRIESYEGLTVSKNPGTVWAVETTGIMSAGTVPAARLQGGIAASQLGSVTTPGLPVVVTSPFAGDGGLLPITTSAGIRMQAVRVFLPFKTSIAAMGVSPALGTLMLGVYTVGTTSGLPLTRRGKTGSVGGRTPQDTNLQNAVVLPAGYYFLTSVGTRFGVGAVQYAGFGLNVMKAAPAKSGVAIESSVIGSVYLPGTVSDRTWAASGPGNTGSSPMLYMRS